MPTEEEYARLFPSDTEEEVEDTFQAAAHLASAQPPAVASPSQANMSESPWTDEQLALMLPPDTEEEVEDTFLAAPISFSALLASAQPLAPRPQATRALVPIAPADANRKRPAELPPVYRPVDAKQQKLMSDEQLKQAGKEYRKRKANQDVFVLTPAKSLQKMEELIVTIDNQVQYDLNNAAKIQQLDAKYAKEVAIAKQKRRRIPDETDNVIARRGFRANAPEKFHTYMTKLVGLMDNLEPQPDKDVGGEWTKITNITRKMFQEQLTKPNTLFTTINWSDSMYKKLLTYLTPGDPLFSVIVGANVYPGSGSSGEGAGLSGGYSAHMYGGYYGVVASTRKSHP